MQREPGASSENEHSYAFTVMSHFSCTRGRCCASHSYRCAFLLPAAAPAVLATAQAARVDAEAKDVPGAARWQLTATAGSSRPRKWLPISDFACGQRTQQPSSAARRPGVQCKRCSSSAQAPRLPVLLAARMLNSLLPPSRCLPLLGVLLISCSRDCRGGHCWYWR